MNIFVSLALIDDAVQDIKDSAVIHPVPPNHYPESEVPLIDQVILMQI